MHSHFARWVAAEADFAKAVVLNPADEDMKKKHRSVQQV
jgi:hypothetical protein